MTASRYRRLFRSTVTCRLLRLRCDCVSCLTLVTMRAQQVVKLGAPYELRDVDVPKPGTNQLLLKTKCAGLCHTESVACAGPRHTV